MQPYEDNGTDEAIKAALVAYEKQLKAERKAFIRETSAKLLAVDFQSEYTKKHFNENHYKAAVAIASGLWDALQKAGC